MDRESMDSQISWFNKHMRLAKSKDCMEPTKVKCVIVESGSPFRFDFKKDVCSATASKSETEWAARTRTVVKKNAAEELNEPDVSIEQPPPEVVTEPEQPAADNDVEEPPCDKPRREESPAATSDSSSSGSTASSGGSSALLLKEIKGLREDIMKFNKTMEGQVARIIRRMDAELQYFKEVSTCLSSIKHSLKK